MVHEINSKGALASDGRLRSGDVILKVNDLDFTSLSYSYKEAITALRQIPWSVTVIRLLVFREERVEDAQQQGSLPEENNQRPRKIRFETTANNTSSDQLPNNNSSLVANQETFCSRMSSSIDIVNLDLNKKSGKGLGISITCFANEDQAGVFVSQVMPGSIAESDARLCVGDHILEVNGKDLRKSSLKEAAVILKVSPFLSCVVALHDSYFLSYTVLQ